VFEFSKLSIGPVKRWDHSLKLIDVLFWFLIGHTNNRFYLDIASNLMSIRIIYIVFIKALIWLFLFEILDLFGGLTLLVGLWGFLRATPEHKEIFIIGVENLPWIWKWRGVYHSFFNLWIYLINILLLLIISFILLISHCFPFLLCDISHILSKLFD